MAVQVLDERRVALFTRERELLHALRATIAGLEPAPPTATRCARPGWTSKTIFLLVIVGEFNAGKSAFINALLGEHVPARRA